MNMFRSYEKFVRLATQAACLPIGRRRRNVDRFLPVKFTTDHFPKEDYAPLPRIMIIGDVWRHLGWPHSK
jgi:hypothetical protein